ncbi:MAG: TatD family hydrolase [Nanobdellota archaeon]
MMTKVDVHCHYDIKNNVDFIETIEKENEIIILNGINSKSNRKCIELSNKSEKIYCALGFHPTEIKDEGEEAFKELENIKKIKEINHKVIAIGEIGLDFFHDKKNKEIQEKVFKKYLSIADKLSLPVIIHARNAGKETINIIKDMKDSENFHQDVLFHCLETSVKNIKMAIDIGAYFSIPSSVIRNEHFQRLLENIPLNKILTETDAPFQSPEKGRESNPEDITKALSYISEKRNLDIKETENIIYMNYQKLFK